MMRHIRVALVVCMVAMAARAQQSLGEAARQNRADQQARQQAIIELVHETMPRDVFQSMMDQMHQTMAAQIEAQAQREGRAMPPDFSAKMKRITDALISYDEMVQWNADIYARRFTLDEIRALRDFYRTPVGRKITREMPAIMSDVMGKVGNTIATRMPAAMKKEGLLPPSAAATQP
jgi:hypothetical protein